VEGVVVVMWYGGMGAGGWVVMGVVAIVFWGLLVVAGIALWRAADQRGPRGHEAPGTSPEQLLDERFARGEIDESEYRARADVLRGAVH
jgi:putative membrane protein